MESCNQGVLGNSSGKFGAVIGSKWRGINLMRGPPIGGKRKPTTPSHQIKQ